MSASSQSATPGSFSFMTSSKSYKESETDDKQKENSKEEQKKAPVLAFKKLQSKNIVSPLPVYSKGNEFSAPVDLSNQQSGKDQQGVVDLKGIQGDKTSQKGVRFKEVPLPPAVFKRWADVSAFGGDPYKGFKDRADLILDALESGNGNLDKSVEYLQDQVAVKGSNIEGVDALSYLEGLRLGAIAVDADVFKDDAVGYDLLSDLIKQQNVNWPGPTDSGEKLPNPLHWKSKRATVLLEALQAGGGNREDSLQYLEKEMNAPSSKSEDAANAYYYLIGLEAYPEFKRQITPAK